MNAIYLCKTIEYYGCTICQKQHFKPEQIYKDHIMFQSKHGIKEMPMKTYLEIQTDLAEAS